MEPIDSKIDREIEALRQEGCLRTVPAADIRPDVLDLSSNDYLGIAADPSLRSRFLATEAAGAPLGAAASRLLGARQREFESLENYLGGLYRGRSILLFNSGYHANTGAVSALLGLGMAVVADKLVHASIIDGIRLGGARVERFRHNDLAHAHRLAKKYTDAGTPVLIIAESVYSMDGDRADIEGLIDLKRNLGNALLYIDEAHALGVCGEGGLGLANKHPEADVIIGTFGKAIGSAGAFAACSPRMRTFLANKSRSFIFSTALPPLQTAWTEFALRRAVEMDSARAHLYKLAGQLAGILHNPYPSHIQPLHIGNPQGAVAMSRHLAEHRICALPIRVPTVPPGTDRIRFSLSANIQLPQLERLQMALEKQE